MGLGALEKVDRQMRIERQLIEGIKRAHDLVMPRRGRSWSKAPGVSAMTQPLAAAERSGSR